jgi:chromosome partitioning protein
MCKPTIVAVANQKGGVGKTAIASAISTFWAHDLDILLVDIDPQGSSSAVFLDKIGATIFDVLTGAASVEEAIVAALPQYPARLKILPSGQRLGELDCMLAGKLDRFHVVLDLVDKIRGFDIVVIDCPGAISVLTLAPLVAADFALLPASCEPMSFDAVDATVDTISTVRRRLNPGLQMLPLALTLYDSRNRLDVEVLGALKTRYAVFDSVVRRRVRIKEELAARHPCTSDDLKNLANEILERMYHEQKAIHAKAAKVRAQRNP